MKIGAWFIHYCLHNTEWYFQKEIRPIANKYKRKEVYIAPYHDIIYNKGSVALCSQIYKIQNVANKSTWI